MGALYDGMHNTARCMMGWRIPLECSLLSISHAALRATEKKFPYYSVERAIELPILVYRLIVSLIQCSYKLEIKLEPLNLINGYFNYTNAEHFLALFWSIPQNEMGYTT